MIYRSPFPDIAIPERPLHEVVLHRAQELGDTPALIDGPSGRTITYAQLDTARRHLAAGLAARGLRKGDVLAIYSPNIPEYAPALFAVVSLGAIVTPVNPTYTADELATQLRETSARFLITVPPLLEQARAAARDSPVETVLVFGEVEIEVEGVISLASLLASDGQPPVVAIDPRADVALLPFSSGTTGLPKGVMLTHANMAANIVQCAHMSDPATQQDSRVMAVIPFYHIYGLNILLCTSIYRGSTVISMPRFAFEPFLEIAQRYRVTSAPLVPSIVVALAKHPAVERYDLSSLERIGSGAAPLSDELEAALKARLNCAIGQGYGMTETSAVTHAMPAGEVRRGSVGVPLPNTECVIVDLVSGAELGPRAQGELWVRGPQVMRGYLNRPDATSATIDAAGWLHTGDVAYADDDGYFYILDRVKELIKYKGMQVAPAELEAILLNHPAVADAAVIPSPDEEAGEVPKAFLVLKPSATAAPADILVYVAERVAPYKKIRRVELVDAIPRGLSGKILRRELVARERGRARGG